MRCDKLKALSLRALVGGWQLHHMQKAGLPSCVDAWHVLLLQSHESYSACGLGSERTDALVTMVRQAAAEQTKPVLFGAKITGGGCGGEYDPADADTAHHVTADCTCLILSSLHALPWVRYSSRSRLCH